VLGEFPSGPLILGVRLHQPAQRLLFAGHLGRLARIGIEGRRRHLRIEFVEAALKEGDVGQKVHAGERAGNCELLQPRHAALSRAKPTAAPAV
jgi:hypothetical protein